MLSANIFQVDTSKSWSTWSKYWKYPKLNILGFPCRYNETVKTLIGLLPKEQSDQGLHCFVSPISDPILKSFMVHNIQNIMQNILRENYFDMVSEG